MKMRDTSDVGGENNVATPIQKTPLFWIGFLLPNKHNAFDPEKFELFYKLGKASVQNQISIIRKAEQTVDQLVKSISTYHDVLDSVRILKNDNSAVTVETLKDYLGISRTTADKYYGELSDRKDTSPLLVRHDRSIRVNGSSAYFLGISIGSTRIRTVLLDLCFDTIIPEQISERFGISKNTMEHIEGLEYLSDELASSGYVYRTPQDSDPLRLRKGISQLVTIFVDSALRLGSEVFPLVGIGFAVSGPVDYSKKIWCYSPRLSIRDITILDIIGYDTYTAAKDRLGVYFSLDNNAKTAIISEYQFLQEKERGKYDSDIGLIYLGKGLSSAAILNQQLMRGSNNFSGELGQVNLFIEKPDGSLTSCTLEELVIDRSLSEDDPNRFFRSCVEYLPYALKTMSCVLGIEKFLLVGHSMDDFAVLGSKLMAERVRFTIPSTQRYCKREEGRNDPNTDAIGAAIESYFCVCHAPSCAKDRINLANSIKWKLNQAKTTNT